MERDRLISMVHFSITFLFFSYCICYREQLVQGVQEQVTIVQGEISQQQNDCIDVVQDCIQKHMVDKCIPPSIRVEFLRTTRAALTCGNSF